jgi:threonine synthase
MDYISTRGASEPIGFLDAVLAGLAPDGGLYVPQSWPTFTPAEIQKFPLENFPGAAVDVIEKLAGDSIEPSIRSILSSQAFCHNAKTFGGFDHPAVAPLVQIGSNEWILELFHGPTLAFKDVAMRLAAGLFDHVLGETNSRRTIVVATSGDTGGAAVDAFAESHAVDLFVLFPKGRISDVQRRFMTTTQSAAVFPIAVEGDFDTCQTMVKGLFQDRAFADKVQLSGVNSINFARILAQAIYYFTAAASLGSPHRKVSFCVPTGNFGDAYAGYAAQMMGLPISKMYVATNANDMLVKAMKTGRYERAKASVQTTSPSMDIQVASNFERLVFESVGRDANVTRALYDAFAADGAFDLPAEALGHIQQKFKATSVTDEEASATIAGVRKATGLLICPHTAVGVTAAKKFRKENGDGSALVTLATAHPAKFPDAVEAACGVRPALPDSVRDLYERAESFDSLPADINQLRQFILANTRAKG